MARMEKGQKPHGNADGAAGADRARKTGGSEAPAPPAATGNREHFACTCSTPADLDEDGRCTRCWGSPADPANPGEPHAGEKKPAPAATGNRADIARLEKFREMGARSEPEGSDTEARAMGLPAYDDEDGG